MVEVPGDTEFRQMQQFEIEDPNAEFTSFFSIKLNKGISKSNFVCSQLTNLMITCHFFITDTLQPLILLDQSYYNIPKETAGTLLGIILVIQLVLKVTGSLVFGHFCDKFGRRMMLFTAAVFVFIGSMLIPSQTSVFPGFICAKIFVALGNTMLLILPFNADYVHDDSKGRASGISVTLGAVGAILGNLILKYLLYHKFSLGSIYYVWGTTVIILFNLANLGLKGGTQYYRRRDNFPAPESSKSVKEILQEAYEIFKVTPWLIIALCLQTLGNADFYILTVIFAIFIKALFPAGTPDSTSNISVNNIQTITLIPALISNLLFGCYIDKTKKVINAIYVAMIGGILGFSLAITVETPTDTALYIGAVILGCTLTGIYTSAQFLGNTYFPQEKRGILLGVMGAFGYMGYMLLAVGGGFLFDTWKKTAPFIINVVVLVIALLYIIYVYKTRIANSH